MENKSNSLNRIKRQQREKVLRFSIRKYSFGAASVAVAALMFLGARVASADSVVPNAPQSSQPNAGVVNPKDNVDSPVDVAASTENKVDAENQALTTAAPSASTVDKTKLKKVVEELNALLSTKLNLDESVVSPVKDRLQKGKEALESSELAQKDIDELVELLSKDVTVVSAAKETTEAQVDKKVEAQVDNTEKPAANLANQSSPEVSASEEGQTVSAKKDALKVSVDQLQAAVLEVPEHETSKEVLEKANELLGLAQVVLENTTVSLNDVEDMTKRVKRMFNSVKNATTRLNSGARDSRNGKSMAQGTNFRANGQINKGALADIRYYASVDPNQNGGRKTRNDEPELTRSKTDIKATYVQDSEGKWIVYDVFFNNDGNKMTGLSKQQEYYFQGPFNIMDLQSNGLYKSNTVKDLYFTRYAPKNRNSGKKLSDGFEAFNQYGNTAYISNFAGQNYHIFNGDKQTMYDPLSGLYRDNQRKDVFKNNETDRELNKLPKNKNDSYPGASYYLGLKVGQDSTDYAVHMHAKIKIRDNVTPEEAAQYGRVYAATTTKGWTTNQSYIMGSWGARLQNDPEAPKDPIQGLTVTKTVGDNPGDKINPVSEGYVRHKNGKSFPAGMNWTWAGDKSPNTDVAGVFKYKSIATYKDGSTSEDKGSGSDGTVTLNVKPKKPAITTNLDHKKGLPGQQITVNVQNGVPNGSKVNLYDGNRLIGTGTTSGGTATVTVTEALPGNPIKAETVVTNANGTVTSDKSNPVTPTPKPDTQPPKLDVTPLEQVVKVGEKISFNVDGRDDTKVNLDFSDIFTKYPNHLFTQQTNYSVNTDKQKTLSIDLGAAKESDIGEKTITFKATDDANHEIVKTVKVKVIPATKENEKHNPTAETVVVGIKQELTDEAIKAKVKNYPSNATLTVKQKPDTDTTGNKTATVIVTYSDKSTDEVTVPVVVRDTTPPKIYWAKDDGSKVELGKTHAEGQNIVIPLYRGDEVNTRLITTDDSGKVTNFKTENLQSGFNFTPVSGTATEGSPLGQNVTGTVGLGVVKGKYTARAISTDGTNTTTGHFVFEVHEQAEKYTPAANTLTVPFNHKITDDEVKGKVIAKPGTPAFPNGTIFEVVSKPETNTAGTDKKAVVKITYPDKSTENIDVPVHVGKDLASQHPLEGQTVTVTVGDSLKTWNGRVDSNQYTNAPKGRGNGVEWGWKGTTPKALQDTAGVFKYTATATHTDKSVAESNPQVTVIVKPKAPTIETDLTGKAELPNTAVVVNVHDGVKDGSIVTLYSQDGRAIGTGTVTNGKATITGTIPKGNITAKTTVQTPGEQDVTSDPSPEKVATTNKAALYPIKGKTATVTVGDSLKVWNGRVDANQYTEAGPNGKGIGVEWGWEGTAPKALQDTAGVFKYTATATHTDKTVAKSDPQVTIIVKPKAPTIETDLTGKSNQENVPVTVSVGEGVKDGSTVTLYGPDGTTVIGTGTVTNGKATAIITGKVPVGNITAKTTVQTPGQDDVVSEPSPIKEATNIAPTAKTQTVGLNEKPNAKNSIGNNGDLPNGTNYTWKTTPDTSTPGDKPGVVTVTYPDGSTIDVPVTVKVTQVSDDYTPKYEDGSGKPGTSVEIPVSEANGKKIPDGTTYTSGTPGITVDKDGKVTVTIPSDKTPGEEVTGKVLVRYPDGSEEEVPVKVTVTNRDKDDYTPKYDDGSGKPGTSVEIPVSEANGKKIPDGTTYTSGTPGITVDKDGKVTVT
ncbi:Rib/alpha-like domain-containing protein, partial [Streptococcus mitis]|uniref:Rib/alpha-like domain-containing protein n=1 Tax=Streptococcus mitis TaxID=28037 RepID=UPI0039C27A8B